ncbi:hypothetical protein PsorP6_000157 [Peronosclerospora sorghi]|uniref:Uncharacterized protein n=1 Tax=Peronosclerospora sorghi TaxID=230839 RepID=A0ACC0WTU4_9STRA|nr:hypothetical protein PsorP6_000157 [Peronosclerospora sorghi]
MVPEVGATKFHSSQPVREQAITESDNNNKLFSRVIRIDSGIPKSSPSASPVANQDLNGTTTSDATLNLIATMSLQDMRAAYNKSKASFFRKVFTKSVQGSSPSRDGFER